MANCTLKTIAKICDVSIITVSKAINGKCDISEATRAKILKVARENGYVPNEGARSLRSGKNKRIGIIYDDFFNPFYQSLISRYYEVFKEAGYTLELVFARDDNNNISPEYISKLPLNIDGIITFVKATQPMVDYYKQRDIPIIQLDINELSDQIDSFSFDDVKAGELLAEHFVKEGSKNVGFIGPTKGLNSSVRRVAGLKNIFSKNNVQFEEKNIIFMVEENIKAIEATKRLLNNGIDTIIYFNDMTAFEGKKFFIENNDQNFKIGGFDNIGDLINYPYKIPTVYGDLDELVEKSSHSLLQKISKKSTKIDNAYISVRFVR